MNHVCRILTRNYSLLITETLLVADLFSLLILVIPFGSCIAASLMLNVDVLCWQVVEVASNRLNEFSVS